jgi:hypothetical protein
MRSEGRLGSKAFSKQRLKALLQKPTTQGIDMISELQ